MDRAKPLNTKRRKEVIAIEVFATFPPDHLPSPSKSFQGVLPTLSAIRLADAAAFNSTRL
jgi:hypothetical protein